MFGIEECIQAFTAELAAPTTLLYAAKRCLRRGGQTVIDPDNSRLERFSQAENAPDVTCEDICAQAVVRVIRTFNRFRFVLKGAYGRDGRKSFLVHAQRVLRHIGHHSRLEETAGTFDALAAAQ